MGDTNPAPPMAEVVTTTTVDNNIAFLWGAIGVLVIVAAAVFAIALLISPERNKKHTALAGYAAAVAAAFVLSLGLGFWWCFAVSALVLPGLLALRVLMRRTFPEIEFDA